MFKGIEDRPGAMGPVGFIHPFASHWGFSFLFSFDRHELSHFSSFVVVHLMKDIACFDRSVTRRGGSIMALHSRYLFYLRACLVLFFFSQFISALFGNRNHWRITVLITDGIHWNGLCWGVGDIPFEP
ncbi:uncharacterized protein BDW43DRAFT_233122 [Aspergillus alliaceus]|uniref:uncharacterized protein n=1 Tax=Petromyces alliaceus TaxID=209559 RepID=UPI0012A5185B|nr:uncharacterized protein BDW43DRAFT_233122 [Aspergillus alliaceus]KAB8228029.1 hypothetical protein BDW43DRAFT_233122 [Aspergillus alliaceus]